MARIHPITTAASQPRNARAALCVAVGVAFVSAVLSAVAGAAPNSAGVPDHEALPPAETWTDGGVEEALLREDGMVRVRITLRDQALLVAASDPAIQAELQAAPAPVSRRAAANHPSRITQGEKDIAIEAESSYEGAIDELQPAADETSDDVERVAAHVEAAGGIVVESEIVPAAVIARVPASRLEGLETLGTVQAIDAAPKPQPQSAIGWQAVGAPSWHAAGFRGGTGPSDTVPADAGVSSELPDPSHPAFAATTVDNYAGITPDDHGTHTASIIASGDAMNRGVAYGVDRLVNGAQAYQLGFSINGNPAAPDPAEVLNYSFASAATSDNVDDGDDITTSFFGVSQALAASNENVDGSPTVANVGRNTMSVAGFNDVGTIASSDDVVLGISSRGPTPGGRKKPDLTAPGGAVVAASSAWNSPPSNPDYTGMTGTSFSSPHVAGAMTLLEGAGITDPMAQRAILINSARDWNGADTGLNGWTSGTQTGWRPEVGWGELDLTTALAQRSYYRLGQVSEGEATFYRATVPAGSKSTMAFQMRGFFTGYPGPPFPVGSTKYTVSNLDLLAYDSSDAEIAPQPAFDPPMTTIDPGPNAQDPNDTVEQLRSPATPASQTVTYKVQSASTIDGAAAEPFALAAAAPLTPLVSPTVRPNSLNAGAADVRCNQAIQITTTTVNDSPDLAATSAQATVQLPSGVSLVSGPATQTVADGNLATSATSETKTWTVQASGEGPKTITVVGSGEAYDTTFTDSDDVTITADCTPPGTSIDSGPSGPTNDPTPNFGFSGSGGPASFECSIDGGAFAACSSPFIAPALSDGSHTFMVRAIDAVGNTDPAPASRSFTVDTVPPDTQITSGPAGAIRSSSAAFGLSGGDSYVCSLDDAPFTGCAASPQLSGLSQGSHTFLARAVDAAGNTDPSAASRSFEVDSSASGAKVEAKKQQRLKGRVAAKLKVSLAEAGTITAHASGRAGPKRIKLEGSEVTLSGSGSGQIRLRASRRTAKAIADLTGDGGRVRLSVTISFRDVLGNLTELRRKITLRG